MRSIVLGGGCFWGVEELCSNWPFLYYNYSQKVI